MVIYAVPGSRWNGPKDPRFIFAYPGVVDGKKNRIALEAEIGGFTKAPLLGLVLHLYRADASNNEFLHARLLSDAGGADLRCYKRIIRAGINPDSRKAPIKLRDARKAISDYKKARGDLSDRLVLVSYFVKCGNDVPLEFGDLDEPFYGSRDSMFGASSKRIRASVSSSDPAPRSFSTTSLPIERCRSHGDARRGMLVLSSENPSSRRRWK